MSVSSGIESLPEATASATTDRPVAVPSSTPPPSIQQASTEFQGWSMGPTGTSAMMCSSGVNFQTSGRFGICCASDPCSMATVCEDNTVTYDNQETFACGTEYSCVTMKLYQTPAPFEVGNPTSIIVCGRNWAAHTIYRNQAPELTTADETVTTTQPISRDTTSTTQTSSSTSAASTDDSTTDSSASLPVGAIAGGVVGGVALVALVALVFWFLRRRSRQRDIATKAQATGNYGAYGAGAPGSEHPSESATAAMSMSQSDRHTWTQSPPHQGGGPEHYSSPGYPMPHGHQLVPQQPPLGELGSWQGHGLGPGPEAMELDGSYANEAGRQRPLSELPVDGHHGSGGSGYGR
ncbi:hypothetical protein VD0002_g7280 [Verticillium dahliae]|uniref:Epidermal growth factor receptor-like transmembrane-juxtamembrane segment domain-containing protein n=4 Tax=Verticillium TaxID=1036719 RepID=G2XIL0_VERDV|nr:uncharacterized protein VDAG_09992 [Verticillium dahliae VdLs.17]EGY20363.1 hypothetical protein VDAG_09992 [Verticillium dahliae VdLs.17]KAH6708002.1 hypothetical protein EV126DRAFT_438382 [Verticillium dahliae]PNH48863.1 hypothetical protein VD0003_g8259 [Verticillium dahliae]PNH60342.1 hypothetical protein VD0002_g7280 [Verticillium dahliae]